MDDFVDLYVCFLGCILGSHDWPGGRTSSHDSGDLIFNTFLWSAWSSALCFNWRPLPLLCSHPTGFYLSGNCNCQLGFCSNTKRTCKQYLFYFSNRCKQTTLSLSSIFIIFDAHLSPTVYGWDVELTCSQLITSTINHTEHTVLLHTVTRQNDNFEKPTNKTCFCAVEGCLNTHTCKLHA